MRRKLLQTVLLLGIVAKGRLFDSILSYRHGTSAINQDTSMQASTEPDVPDSLDDLFAYTAIDKDGIIDVVHCYSMRNGLYGTPSEARILWSKVNPDVSAFEDAYRRGLAHHDYVVSLPIQSPITQFTVYETDLTAFLISVSVKRLLLTLHVVPGPLFKERPVRSYDFAGLRSFDFVISSILLLPPEANKLVFHGIDFVGEINLSAYPFTTEEINGPDLKIYRFQGHRDEKVVIGPFSDNSSRAQLLQIQPGFEGESGAKWGDKLFLLANNKADFKTSLRIDVVKASEPLGSTVNIARINTEAIAAHQAAKFAQIAQETTLSGGQKHIFATAAYQNYPDKAIFVSISEVTDTEGTWSNDRSHAFSLTTDQFAQGGYVEPLIVRRNRVQPDPLQIKFEVFLVDERQHLFRMELIVQQDPHLNWAIVHSRINKSPMLKMDIQIKKIIYQPAHLTGTNEHWPEFYIFLTRTSEEQLVDGKERVRDGLMFSENRFRFNKRLTLMDDQFDVTEQFESSLWGAQPGMAYADSTILTENDPDQQAWNRTLIFSEPMKVVVQQPTVTKRASGYGTDWVENLAVCSSTIDYSKVLMTGITADYLISYMDSQTSSAKTVLKNQLTLVKDSLIDTTLMIYNDLDFLLNETYDGTCQGDVACAGSFALAFYEESIIVECDAEKKASDKVWYPSSTQPAQDAKDLVGQAWRWRNTNKEMPCYLATLKVDKLDGTKALIYSPLITKLIVVNEPGRPPFLISKVKSLYAQAGKLTELKFSNSTDPEGREVIMIFKLGKAAKFTYWDQYSLTLTVEEWKTEPRRDEGKYPITVKMIEVMDGVRMPPIERNFNLTIGFFSPPREESDIPDPLNQPRVSIQKFKMDGRMTINLSQSLNFPDKLFESMYISILPGALTDPEVLGFNYVIEETSSSSIDLKFNFDNPHEISQQFYAERMNVTIYLGNFTYPSGEDLDGFSYLTSFVPRQIPSENQVNKLEAGGIAAKVLTVIIGAASFIISLFLLASMNHLWSMLNGLQLATHMPLLKSAFPANAGFFVTFLIDVATFDMLPSVATFNIFDVPNRPAYNLAFQDNKYGSMFSVVNLGTLFFLLNIYLLQVIMWLICSALRDKYSFALKCYQMYDKWLFWGGLMRLFFEAYLEITISIFIAIPAMEWSGPDYTAAVLYSNMFTALLGLLLIGLPIFIMSFYSWHAAQLEDKVFLARYGNIIEGLWLSKDVKKRKAVLIYPFWFCLRRILFAIICIEIEDDTLLQIVLMFILAMITMCYLILFQPFLHTRINTLEIMNETTNFILLYHIMLFSGMIADAETRYLTGWSFIFVTSLNLIVHLAFLLHEMYQNLRKWRIRKATSKIKPKPVLQVIMEESYESNFSDKHEIEKKRKSKLSQSDWNTVKMGGSTKGFDLGKITWNDLGSKFMNKRDRKSKWADIDPRSRAIGSAMSRSYTLDDRFENLQMPNDLAVLSNEGEDRQLVAQRNAIDTSRMNSTRQGTGTELRRQRHTIAAFRLDACDDDFEVAKDQDQSQDSSMDGLAAIQVDKKNIQLLARPGTCESPIKTQTADLFTPDSHRSVDQEGADTGRVMIKIDTCTTKQVKRNQY